MNRSLLSRRCSRTSNNVAEYSLFFKASAIKDLEGIPKQHLQKIMVRMEGLRSNPRPPGSEKLSGQDRYRIRQGVIYSIHDFELSVWIVKVAHRRELYR
ncbi:type II toxin-antitoxin system RelE family toxin [Geomonas sp. Red276]